MPAVLLDEMAKRPNRILSSLNGVAKEALGYIALAGGAFFGLAWLVLTPFYDQFNVEPDEVGWTTTAVLSQFALPWVVLLALVGFVAFVLMVERSKLVALARWLGRIPFGRSTLVALIVVLLLSPFLLLREDYIRTSERIKAGAAVSNGAILDLFPVQAECVKLSPNGNILPSPIDPDVSYLLLGEANGNAVVRDSTMESQCASPSPP
jgi:hypothetical protein